MNANWWGWSLMIIMCWCNKYLSMVLRGLLPRSPRHAIYKLCSYFNRLCQCIIDRKVMVDIYMSFWKVLSSVIFWYNDTFDNSFGLWSLHMWTDSILLDVPIWKVHIFYLMIIMIFHVLMNIYFRYMKVLKWYVWNKA